MSILLETIVSAALRLALPLVTDQLAFAILEARIKRKARMVTSSHLVIYGNSVFLAGIRAQLEHISALEVITMEAAPADMTDWVRACRTQVVLFDLAMGYPDFVVELLHKQPSLLLIGVDPSSNELLVLSGQQERAVAMEDLLRVIRRDDTQKGRCRNEEI